MVRIAKVVLYTLFFILALIFFTPKHSVYYFIEKQLEPFSVVISDESVLDNGFSLGLEDAKLSFQAIDTATVSQAQLSFFLLHNSLKLNQISLASVAKSFVPTKVDSLYLRYSIFNPINIVGDSKGEFGEADININLLERLISIELKPSNVMLKNYANVLKQLRKTQKGEYVYEKNF